MSDSEIAPGGGKSCETCAKSYPDTLARVLARMRNDRYTTEDARDDVDLWHRRSWNAAMDHAIAIVSQGSVEAGLVELREAKVSLPRHWLAEHEAGAHEGEGG